MKQSKKAYIASLKKELDHEWCGNKDVKRVCSLCRGNPCNYDLCVDCLRNMINKLEEK